MEGVVILLRRAAVKMPPCLLSTPLSWVLTQQKLPAGKFPFWRLEGGVAGEEGGGERGGGGSEPRGG